MGRARLFPRLLSRRKCLVKETKPKHPLLKLHRIRDFISLWLSYPVGTVHDSKLKLWMHEVSNAHCVIAETYRLMRENPLRYLEGLIPIEMIMEIEAGGSSVFVEKNVIPKAILSLAADLAVDHLVQTLLSGEHHVRIIRRVMLSTRNGAEGREIFEKIELILKNKDNSPRFYEIFHEVFFVDASRLDGQEGSIFEKRTLDSFSFSLGFKFSALSLIIFSNRMSYKA